MIKIIINYKRAGLRSPTLIIRLINETKWRADYILLAIFHYHVGFSSIQQYYQFKFAKKFKIMIKMAGYGLRIHGD